jgi:hypothetical protein
MKYIMMGVSSNFGNMFSAAGGSVFLPFLPMSAIQILLNNLLYDTSQTMLTTDNVDEEYVEKPKRWDISFIRRFMVTLGPVSSIFDFLTFFTMIFVFGAWTNSSLFQTGWFVESLCSQTLVVLIIRTRRVPFYKSKPSKYLIAMLLGIIGFGILVPFTPLATFFGFVALPPAYFLVLAGILGVYTLLAEAVKLWFYRRNAHRLEQFPVPKRRTIYFGQAERLMQDILAIVCLRLEDEISINSLTDDLNSVVKYVTNSKQITRSLQHLKRSGAINVDWRVRNVIRSKSLKDYVLKNVVGSEKWPVLLDDWRRTSAEIMNRRGGVNSAYQELLSVSSMSPE